MILPGVSYSECPSAAPEKKKASNLEREEFTLSYRSEIKYPKLS